MTFAAADLDASPKAAAGQFRTGVDPLNCYVTLVGMGYYIAANRFTVESFMGRLDARASRTCSALAGPLDQR